MSFVVLIGASGAGKTTIAREIARRSGGDIEVFHFDDIGVPSMRQMIAKSGSGENWQRIKTAEWMARLAPLAACGRALLFEGQTRISFVAEAARAAGVRHFLPILVDCDDQSRLRRLSEERKQPEPADDDMLIWARFLRAEAKASGCAILDTSALALEPCVQQVMARLRADPHAAGAMS